MAKTTCRPLPPVVLTKDSRAECFQVGADLVGGGGDGGPRERFVGVEVDDEAVGVLEVPVAGAPGVEFEDGHLGKGS